jgi:hypothetical protein
MDGNNYTTLSDYTIESETLSKLPLLLAGPILRRAEPSQVCIWIACSKAVSIQAEIFRVESDPIETGKIKNYYNDNDNQPNTTNPIGFGSAKSIRLGENLYIGLVVARPLQSNTKYNTNNSSSDKKITSNFPTDELLAYDIEITYYIDSGPNHYQKKSERLKDLGLLSGKNSIVYNNDYVNGTTNNKRDNCIQLPTFFIRGRKTRIPLNLLYGSCRKLHGRGEDCLVIADELISNSVDDLNKRPSALFLTGDQIYADDVADPLIEYLARFSVRLLGWEEQINGLEKRLTELRIGERQQIVNEHAKFTSESAANHLLSFGEYAAMYLVAWNIENWPEKYPNDFKKAISQKEQKNIDLQIDQLKQARKVMPSIRRVLANIPTYMICDDHEITDDWNITREWIEEVKASKCGKQIVANGLAAYWAFQAWGNNPELYNDDFINFITGYLAKDGNVTTSEKNEFENYLWNFHNWTFDCPTNPSTIFLDCRTQRQFDSFQGPPQLINEEELQSVLRTVERVNYEKGDPLILVIPTPVFGFELAETLQKYLASKSSIYKWDLETWAANERGFVSFLSFLIQNLRPHHCVFLSGDVHYGFTISATFRLLSATMERYIKNKEHQQEHKVGNYGDNPHYLSMNITQLNSSAIKTTSLGKEILLNEVIGRFHQFFTQRHSIRIGWNNNISCKARKLKENDSELHAVIDRFGHKSNVVKDEEQQYSSPPDWIESRSILKASGSGLSSLIIADNNLGLVSIYGDRYKILSHKLLVRTVKEATTKIHETITELGT